MKQLVLLLISAVALCGADKPPPASSLTFGQAVSYAAIWQACDQPNRNVGSSIGTSMLPAIGPGFILLEERVRPGDLQPGDIAIYEAADHSHNICHRVAEVGKDGSVIFKGDNNAQYDGWVSFDRIRWRVAGLIFTQKQKSHE